MTFTCKQTIQADCALDEATNGRCSDATSDCWVWRNEGDNLYFDNHETVRVQIEEEEWCDQSPQTPLKAEEVAEKRQPPYSLKGTMGTPGLGPVLWWESE